MTCAIPEKSRKRRRLFWLQRGVCAGCETRMDLKAEPLGPDYPTLDHVIPHSKGGPNTLANLLLKHRRCNERRKNAPPNERDRKWQAIVAERAADPDDLQRYLALTKPTFPQTGQVERASGESRASHSGLVVHVRPSEPP